MFSDLLTFTTPKFQRAHMVLALLQLALRKAGLMDDARRLEGLDLVDPAMGTIALEILRAMNVQAAEVKYAHGLAVEAVQDALRSTSVFPQSAN
jgi:hypothetical protein